MIKRLAILFLLIFSLSSCGVGADDDVTIPTYSNSSKIALPGAALYRQFQEAYKTKDDRPLVRDELSQKFIRAGWLDYSTDYAQTETDGKLMRELETEGGFIYVYQKATTIVIVRGMTGKQALKEGFFGVEPTEYVYFTGKILATVTP